MNKFGEINNLNKSLSFSILIKDIDKNPVKNVEEARFLLFDSKTIFKKKIHKNDSFIKYCVK